MFYVLDMGCLAKFVGDRPTEVQETLSYLQQLAPELYGAKQDRQFLKDYPLQKHRKEEINLWMPLFEMNMDLRFSPCKNLDITINANAFDAFRKRLEHLEHHKYGSMYHLSPRDPHYFVSERIARKIQDYDLHQYQEIVDFVLTKREQVIQEGIEKGVLSRPKKLIIPLPHQTSFQLH